MPLNPSTTLGPYATPPAMALTVGSRLGHYDVTALIGEGGMGQAYQATDTKLNRQVALNGLVVEAKSAV